MRIEMVKREDLKPEVVALYDEQVNKHGRITNMKKTLLQDPQSFEVLMEWYPLYYRVCDIVGDFAANVFCHAISTGNDCLICSTFFRRILIDSGKNPDNLVLNETEQLMLDYGKALVTHPVIVPDALYKRLSDKFDSQTIVLLTAFGSMMIATNLINNALQVPLDECLYEYRKK